MPKKNWEKHLSVDKRIVRLLSVFTYEDFPRSIREMVSNAYDADATEVKIRIDLNKDLIEITDDGNGMTPDEFDFFLRIAGQQRASRFSPEFRRKRIGQFGIGFLAVFPFGRRIRITSSARRSNIRFEATIQAEKYVQETAQTIDVQDIPVVGFQEESPELTESHGTSIKINGLSELTRRYFKARSGKKRQRQTIKAWSSHERLVWTLSEDLPLDYNPDSPYSQAFANLGSSGLRVFLNEKELLRNAPGSQILESDTRVIDGAKCQYVIATDWKAIQPVENRFFKQRVRNVGIGERTAFGLGLEGRAYSRLQWLTGEIRILDGFDDLINIDRKSFRESTAYDNFRDFFSQRLAHFANFLESVSEAQRDIDRQIKSSRFAEVGPKRQVVQRNIDRLADRGFEVLHRPAKAAGKKSAPVVVDVKRKRVEVVDDHPAFRDTISIDSNEIPVRYLSWDGNQKQLTPVRRAKDGAIEVNTDYPLFKSVRYGDLFKRTFIVLLTVSEKQRIKSSLLAEVGAQLQKEFSDLS